MSGNLFREHLCNPDTFSVVVEFTCPAGKKPVKFLYSVSDGQYVSTAKVDISIVQGRACYVSMPSTLKGGHKKLKA